MHTHEQFLQATVVIVDNLVLYVVLFYLRPFCSCWLLLKC